MKKWMVGVPVMILVVACTKNAPGSGMNEVRLIRIETAGRITAGFSYDDKNRLTRYESPNAIDRQYSYDAKGRLVRIDTYINVSSSSDRQQIDHGYSILNYNDSNRLVETGNYRDNNLLASKAIPDYDANGRTISVTLYDDRNVAYIKNVYRYDVNGNVAASEEYDFRISTTPTVKRVYEYDKYNNPMKGIGSMPWCVNENNLTKEVDTSFTAPPGIAPVSYSTVIYNLYDALRFPVSINSNGVEYKYIYAYR